MLWIGARGGLESWAISLGTLTAFVLLLQRAFAPLAALGEQWQTVQGALAGVERVFEVLAVSPDLTGATRGPTRWRRVRWTRAGGTRAQVA